MKLNPRLQVAIEPLLNAWLRQLGRIGQLLPCAEDGTLADPRESGLLSRIGLILSLFRAFEERLELSLEDGEVPILYNTANWPQDAPIAGYSRFQGVVRPTHVCASYYTAWTVASKDGIDVRVLKAALARSEQVDWEPLIDYLFDLCRFGYVSDGFAITRALLRLLRGAAATGGLARAAHALLTTLPRRPADWLNVSFVEKPDLPPPSETDLRRVIDHVFHVLEEEVERLRGAANFSEWFGYRHGLYPLLSAAVSLGLEFREQLDIVQLAQLDQWEEICCDCGAYQSIHRLGDVHPYRPDMAAVNVLSRLFSSEGEHGHDWRTRLVEERCAIPRQLAALLSDDQLMDQLTLEDAPPEWLMLGPDWITPARLMMTEEVPAVPHRLNPLPEAAVDQLVETHDWGGLDIGQIPRRELAEHAEVLSAVRRCHDLKGVPDFEGALTVIENALLQYPTSNALLWERAILLDLTGRPNDAVGSMISILADDPEKSPYWHSMCIILRNVGAREEAALSAFIKELLERREGVRQGLK